MSSMTTPSLPSTDVDWSQTITAWLQSLRSEATRRAYARALEDLLASSGQLPWEITDAHISTWIETMESRGNSAATIELRVTAVKKFYEHAGKPLSHEFTGSVPNAAHTEKHLQPDEAKRFLQAIFSQTPTGSRTAGSRNYALFLGYILLSDSSRWRTIRWGDVIKPAEHDRYIPLPVINAVCAYLRIAGRLETIQPIDHVFIAIQRPGQPVPCGKIIDARQPISAHEVGRLLARYLRAAGIDPERIKPHSLHHTGDALRTSLGDSIVEIMDFLGNRRLAETNAYIHHVDQAGAHWLSANDLVGNGEE